MYSFLILLSLLLISPVASVFDAACNEKDGHLQIESGNHCTVNGPGNVIRSISLGVGSGIQFTDYSSAIIEGDIRIPSGCKFSIYTGTHLTVNGHLTIAGNMLLSHGTNLIVQDSLTLLRDSDSAFQGEVSVKAQDFIMESGSRLVGDGSSHLGGTALGFPTVANHGGVAASTSMRHVVIQQYTFSNVRPSAHGVVHSPRYAGSPGSNGSGNVGGKGGAAIQIEVENTMTIDGEISSSGQDVVNSGTGAGGSIELTSKVLKRSTGAIRVNGGASNIEGGGGSGGRVAIKCVYSEYADVNSSERPLGIAVEANGKGQGPGTIWYDCGAMRTTLWSGRDTVLEYAYEGIIYLNIADFEGMIVREINFGDFATRLTTDTAREDDVLTFRFGTLYASEWDNEWFFNGKLYPRSHPHPHDEACFDYRVRPECPPHQEKYAVYHEKTYSEKPIDLYFPQNTVMTGEYMGPGNLSVYGAHLTVKSKLTSIHNVEVETFHAYATSRVSIYNEFSVSRLLMVDGQLTLFNENGHIEIDVDNFYMGKDGVLDARSGIFHRTACDNAVLSFAGCQAANNCLPSYKPYGLFYDVKETGSATTCPTNWMMSALVKLKVADKFSMAGKLITRPGRSTGGAVRMQLKEVVHMSGLIDISGFGDTIGASAGRAMITCETDPFHSMFHLKINADGGCTNTGCGATGSVYIDCGYFKNYLKVVTTGTPPFVPSPTHLIVDRNYDLDTIEVSDKGNLYFTSVNANSYTVKVNRIISSASPRVQKASTIRLMLGQSQPKQLPTAASINSLTSGYLALRNSKQTEFNQLMGEVESKYLQQLDLLWKLHEKSTAHTFCSRMLAMCLADECSGESTRFTRTGRETVGVRMSVDTFKNPLDVRTAKETLRDSLSNFYDIPQEDVIVSDPIESGTRVLNVTVNVSTDVDNFTRRELLRKSSRIDDSPVESCFKRVNL